MLKHIIKTQNFTREFLFGENGYEGIFKSANEMRNLAHSGGSDILKGKIIATWFAEESTRTRLSFESAALRLGAGVISSTNARQFSSEAKGEVLEDTIRVLQCYSDCIVIRYHEEGGAARAAHVSNVPIINAGDGSGQHPTQSLLDLFTIYDELGQIDGLHVGLVGDLKHGRTIHSLAYLLGKFNDIRVSFISPQNLMVPDDITSYLNKHNVYWDQYHNLGDIIKDIDVLYQTRIQKERFKSIEDYNRVKGELIIDRVIANSMKSDAIIMHPLPRVDEVRYSVDDNYRARYFAQAENGLYVRMALLKLLLPLD
ncbi:MAG: aspartate carbamoyltransferase [Candidatus Hodarchaeales archaeon]|jgi:aspartate carbamoyltransferase catalytic subunit